MLLETKENIISCVIKCNFEPFGCGIFMFFRGKMFAKGKSMKFKGALRCLKLLRNFGDFYFRNTQ